MMLNLDFSASLVGYSENTSHRISNCAKGM